MKLLALVLCTIISGNAFAVIEIATCKSSDETMSARIYMQALNDVPLKGKISIGEANITLPTNIPSKLVDQDRVFSASEYVFALFYRLPNQELRSGLRVNDLSGNFLGSMVCCYSGLSPVTVSGEVICH